MATLTTYAQPTLLELAKNVDAYGRLIPVINVLAKKMGIMQILPFFEGNAPFSHKTVKDSYLGDGGSWRAFNEGVGVTNPRTIEEWNVIGMLNKYFEVDAALCDSMPEPQQYRNQKCTRVIESMSQEVAATNFYGNHASAPAEYYGLAVRMDTLNTNNILGCGHDTAGACTSVYVVQPGAGQVWMAYPRGHKTLGVEHEDRGKVDSSTATTAAFNSAMLPVYRDFFSFYGGLVVEDERCIGRLANIATTGSSNLFDPNLLIEILDNLKDGGTGAYILVNKKVRTQMQIMAKDKTNIYYTFDKGDGLSGQRPLQFNGVPILLDESILYTEDPIT